MLNRFRDVGIAAEVIFRPEVSSELRNIMCEHSNCIDLNLNFCVF